ncbi:hemolysin family protein [Corticicoccus populi]|uniref:Hemolysin family protein n=1 Tax=Corticicoccus populi TaxID=1812821 RepID=A0ABW5WWE1_9STAP
MLIAIILLLLVSAFFSSSETALTAVDKRKIQTQAKNGDEKAERLYKLLSTPSEFITTILIGNNIANIILPTIVTAMAIQYEWSVAFASLVITVTIIVCSEVVPKSVAAAFPERISYAAGPVIRLVIIVLKPVTWILNKLTDAITRILSKGENPGWTVSKEEILNMVEIADSEGSLHKDESDRLKGVLDFQNLNVKDVLTTPRTEMDAIKMDAAFDEVRRTVVDLMHTRYPVYDNDLDDIVGVFHSKYILQWSLEPDKTLMDFCDPEPLMIYEFQPVEEVLRKMTKERRHLAVVLDEYGGTEGILTHEDIIESMLGFDIEDETDLENDALIDYLKVDEIVCDGKITLHRLNIQFDTDISEEEDTLSGYLFKLFYNIPEEGDTMMDENHLKFEVLIMENQMIRKVRITKTVPSDNIIEEE